MARKLSPDRALTASIRKKDIRGLRESISSGAKVNRQSSEGESPLMLAVSVGFVEGIRELLHAGANPKLKDIEGWTVAYHAIESADVDVIRLLAEDLPPGQESRVCSLKLTLIESPSLTQDERLLIEASELGDTKQLALLLNKCQLVDIRDDWGQTPLMIAASNNQKKAVSLLLKSGAMTDMRCLNDWYPLEHAAYKNAGGAYYELYDHSPNSAKQRTERYVVESQERYAWRYDRPDLDIVRATQNIPDDTIAALEQAARLFGGGNLMSMMGELAVPSNVTDSDGRGPLFWAVSGNNLDLLLELLKNGYDPNQTDYFNACPLYYACTSESKFQIARVLWSRTSTELRKTVSSKVLGYGWNFT